MVDRRGTEDRRPIARRYYQSHKAVQIERVHQRREAIRRFVWSIKEQSQCAECGFTDPRALDFHHRDSQEKEESLYRVHIRGWGKERILAEIAKCDVLCANCHRIRHAKR